MEIKKRYWMGRNISRQRNEMPEANFVVVTRTTISSRHSLSPRFTIQTNTIYPTFKPLCVNVGHITAPLHPAWIQFNYFPRFDLPVNESNDSDFSTIWIRFGKIEFIIHFWWQFDKIFFFYFRLYNTQS